jgi:hypothetical protein
MREWAMLITGYKTRLGSIGVLTAVLAMGAAPRALGVDTLIGGFNGNLSSPFGADWRIVTEGWSTELTPALSEGTGAVRVYHNTNFQGGFQLPGGEGLAQAIVNNDLLELDIIAPFGINWRQLFPVMNDNFGGWSQGAQYDLTFPTEAQPFQTISIDLANSNGNDWKTKAQNWLNNRVTPGDPEWFELVLVFQGEDQAYSADFDFNQGVDANDFLIWQENYGNDFAGPEQGDANADFIVDNADLQQWAEQFGRRLIDPYVTIDNVNLVANTPIGSAVPEPGTLAAGAIGAVLSIGGARRRRRNS